MESKILPIAGDASFRKFYRLKLKKKNKIIIFASKDKYTNLVAYSAVNNFLRNNRILAPKLYEHNLSKGILIIEDFGDTTFNKILVKKNSKFPIYKKLVDLLIKIQKIKPKSKLQSIINKPHIVKKYSKKILHKESDLFFDWYLPLFLNKKKNQKLKKKTKKIYRIKREKFLEDFDILSVQRSLKIIGIFSRLFKRDKKKRYVKFIPYTWKLLEKRMKSKIFLELRKLFENNISKKTRNKIIH